jgi:hypothetical protein
MRTETINIYQIDELSNDAKEKARDWYRQNIEYHWSDESKESIEAFCSHFGVTLKDWEIGAFCPFYFSTDAENTHFRGLKLSSFDREHMPTGYYLDCDLWMTFFDVFKATGDAKGAFNDALSQGFKAWRDDLESQHEDEYIDDFLLANGIEFLESGEPA